LIKTLLDPLNQISPPISSPHLHLLLFSQIIHQIYLKPFNPSKSLSYSSKNISRSEWPLSLAKSLAVLPYKYEKEIEKLEIDLTFLSLKNRSAPAFINTFAFSN